MQDPIWEPLLEAIIVSLKSRLVILDVGRHFLVCF